MSGKAVATSKTAQLMANQATHAGTRRSERKKPVRHPHPYDGISDIQAHTEETMKELFPGMHPVIISKTAANDPRAASPVGLYKGQGYKILSEDPEITGHADNVLMGIDLETWLKREDDRVADQNEALTSLITEQNGAFEGTPGLTFRPSESGFQHGDPITITGKNEPNEED